MDDTPLTHTLANGLVVTLRDRDTMTERLNRIMVRAYMRGAGPATKLARSGFDPSDPSTWGVLATLSDAEMDGFDAFKAASIAVMVIDPVFTTESALDLDPVTFDELADIANAAWRGPAEETEDERTGEPHPLAEPGVRDGSSTT